MDINPELAKQVAPGLGGALTAAIFTKGPFWLKGSMFIVGAISAYFAGEWAGRFFGEVSDRTASYLVGCFAPYVIRRVIDTWENLDLLAIIKSRLGGVIDKSTDKKE